MFQGVNRVEQETFKCMPCPDHRTLGVNPKPAIYYAECCERCTRLLISRIAMALDGEGVVGNTMHCIRYYVKEMMRSESKEAKAEAIRRIHTFIDGLGAHIGGSSDDSQIPPRD